MYRLFKGLTLGVALAMGSAMLHAGPVNINTADEEALAKELEGVGPALAAAIVRDREENGPYKTAEEITRVSGIASRVLEMNKGNILVSDESAVAD